MQRLTFLIVVFSMIPFLAKTSTKDLESAIYQIVPFGAATAALETRLELTRAISAYWEDFSQRVPRLSPTEEEWVKTEVNSGGERLERAVNSPEYALRLIDIHIEDCLSTTQSLLESITDPKLNETEMFYWVKLINCYDGSNDLPQWLGQAGLSNGKIDGKFQLILSGLIQRQIVNVVIPSAMAEAMDWTFSGNSSSAVPD